MKWGGAVQFGAIEVLNTLKRERIFRMPVLQTGLATSSACLNAVDGEKSIFAVFTRILIKDTFHPSI